MKANNSVARNALPTFAQKVKYLEARISNLAKGMPSHMDASRLVRSAVVKMNENPDLLECSEESVYGALSVAANLGLEIVGGQGFLVAYKKKCTFVPGWQGIVDLITRTGRASVWTGAVFDGDVFDWGLGDSPFVKHQPQGEDDVSKITHVYAVGRVKGGDWPVIEVWTMDRVKKHLKKYNKVGARHYAFDNMEMYARKVVLLQVSKYLPKSQELVSAISALDAADEGRGMTLDGEFLVKEMADGGGQQGDGNDDKAHGEQSQQQGGGSQPADDGEGQFNTLVAALKSFTELDQLDERFDRERAQIAPAFMSALTAVYRECREKLSGTAARPKQSTISMD
jgi:recombination protein RecT